MSRRQFHDELRLIRGDRSGADLSGAVFHRTDASGARFVKTRLDGADFSSALLQGADFHEALLARTRFDGARVRAERERGQADSTHAGSSPIPAERDPPPVSLHNRPGVAANDTTLEAARLWSARRNDRAAPSSISESP